MLLWYVTAMGIYYRYALLKLASMYMIFNNDIQWDLLLGNCGIRLKPLGLGSSSKIYAAMCAFHLLELCPHNCVELRKYFAPSELWVNLCG